MNTNNNNMHTLVLMEIILNAALKQKMRHMHALYIFH